MLTGAFSSLTLLTSVNSVIEITNIEIFFLYLHKGWTVDNTECILGTGQQVLDHQLLLVSW